MAVYHLSAAIVGRSVGRTVTAAAAYRAGERIVDQRTGLVFDYRRRAGVAHIEIMAPGGAPAWMRSRAALWNGVEAGEKRKDSQLAREIELGLPHELTPAQRLELVRSFVAVAFVSQGMVVDIAIHAPGRRRAEKRNHHAHVLLTMRAIEGDGFGAKVRAWNDTARLEAWRASWADHVNRALAAAGESARVDHRSLEAQGIDRLAQIQIGPAAAEMEARGITTDRGDMARKIAAINAALADIEEPAATSSPPTAAPVMEPPAEPPRTLDRADNAAALTPPEPPAEGLYQRGDTAPEPAMRGFGASRTASIIGAIKSAFRQAARTIMLRADNPRAPKRRSGSGEAFPMAARAATAKPYAAATAYLTDTLDWLNLWQGNAGLFSNAVNGFNAVMNLFTLHL